MAARQMDWVLGRVRRTLLPRTTDAVTDAELLRRFVRSRDESAFEALLRRHARMVLGVCRRVLGNDADTEDAFQATFLVFVRKAPSIRPAGMVGNWLYGVAHRTALEVKTARAKRRAKEAQAMPRTETQVNEATDLRVILDQELSRVPDKYRAVVVLCDLEGKTRREAAHELGAAEGTIASRLVRGRAILTRGLAKRGFSGSAGAPAAALAAGDASACVPSLLVTSTLKAVSLWAAGQSTATVVSTQGTGVAQGVLRAMLLTKLKITTAVFLAVAGAGLGVGRLVVPTWAADRAVTGIEPPAKEQQPAARDAPPKKSADESMLTGMVVDDQGLPVAGAQIRMMGPPQHRSRATTAADGTFRLPMPDGRLRFSTHLWAEGDGGRLGLLYLDKAEPGTAVRVVLKPCRESSVKVVDAQDRPIDGARVTLLDGQMLFPLLTTTTGADGSATLRFPADAVVGQIFATKSGAGFDYVSTLAAKRGQERTPRRTPLPEAVALKLAGARTVRVKAVDSANRPVAGVSINPWYVKQHNKPEDVNLSGSEDVVTKTDASGVAVFDWLPEDFEQSISFLSHSQEYSYVEPVWIKREAPAAELTMRLLRKARIAGRVLAADGRPASGIAVEAMGAGVAFHNGHGRTVTKADGSYEMMVNSEEAYIVTVVDDRWAAASKLGVVVREDKPVGGLDFHLAEGTVVRGTVTVGPDRRPVPDQHVTLAERAGEIPAELKKAGDNIYHEVHHLRHADTDGNGRFQFRVGPGVYDLRPSTNVVTKPLAVTVVNQREVKHDFHIPRPEMARLNGTVVDAGGRPVAGAAVWGVYTRQVSRVPMQVATADDGTFSVDRVTVPAVMYAGTADRSRAGIARIGPDDRAVTIRMVPTADAQGRLLDDAGQPAAGGRVKYGIQINLGDADHGPFETWFGGTAVSGPDGRYTLRGLVVGEEFHVSFEHDPEHGPWSPLTTVKPSKAERVALADMRVPRLYRPPTLEEKTEQFFRNRGDLRQRVARARAESKSHYLRVLLIVADPKAPTAAKLTALREDETIAPALWEHEQVAVAADDAAAKTVLREEYGLDVAKAKLPALVVLGEDSKVMAQTSLELERATAAKDVKAFLAAHALPRRDAERLVADALARAQAENKRVWLQESATWCGWCRVLTRFLDEHRPIFDANYVVVEIDRSRCDHGEAVMKRYRPGKDGGIPWCAILDADGRLLANWDGPDGNIGFPSGAKGIDFFLQVLTRTAPRLTAAQVAELRNGLEGKK
jgi:RNA polymerase sigma factor (sigma-70 family)